MGKRELGILVLGICWPACCPAAEEVAEVHWQAAPAAAISADRPQLRAGPTLEQLAAEAASAQPPKTGSVKTSRTVIESEPFPLRYRRIIRRYFELIRQPLS